MSQYPASAAHAATRRRRPTPVPVPIFDGSQACAGADLELFFPSRQGRGSTLAVREAKALCARCRFLTPCLEYALAAQGVSGVFVDGVWGGTTRGERTALRRGRGHLRHLRAAS